MRNQAINFVRLVERAYKIFLRVSEEFLRYITFFFKEKGKSLKRIGENLSFYGPFFFLP